MDHLTEKQILRIIARYNNGTASNEEKDFLEAYSALSNSEDDLTESLNKETLLALKENLKKQIDLNIKNKQAYLGKKINYRWLSAAAAVVFVAAIGLYFKLDKTDQGQSKLSANVSAITPGGNKAFLILDDGTKLDLDAVGNGKVAQQSGISISKTTKGQLVYTVSEGSHKDAEGRVAYNTIQTPRGGQYLINLPDGTRVWLNAASSLRFPVTFTGNERKVVLTGEAYFEVAKYKMKPFKVTSRNQVVEVLGTHFNINSYLDEGNVKTTLVEGSVKVHLDSKKQSSLTLVPGQQAVNANQAISLNEHPKMEEILSWKNGSFQFDDASLSSIMRQLSRWYDVDVEFIGAVPDYHFRGTISRDTPLSQIFEILKTGGLNFKVDGRRIIVQD
ncbi:FecR family protein [Pedobacter nyackensis]|uniref:FecR family protein n=1 Tax=Pedobacter nyackensis TaxID=475255 RepID=UPI00292E4872|nr:FecR domain-containing protein [Pedobacter nyackensis]